MTVTEAIEFLLGQPLDAQLALPSDATNKMVKLVSSIDPVSKYHKDWIEDHIEETNSGTELHEFVVIH